VKPKKYDFKDSNLALFGSDTEKNLKSKEQQSLLTFVAVSVIIASYINHVLASLICEHIH
jgi:hypothetical protein